MATASDSFTGVDLSRLPAPGVVETLDYEQIVADSIAQLQLLFPEFDAALESEPVFKLIQLFAWREMIWRQRQNDAARARMAAFAVGSDLDQIAASFGVERFIITPADVAAGTPAVLESDEDFRTRMVLAPEGYSVAGPEGAYIFHALTASSDVRDASAISPTPGEVLVTVLARGEMAPKILQKVTARLNSDTIRPLTDLVTVQPATVLEFAIAATSYYHAGPDRAVVMAAQAARLNTWLADNRRLGRDVTRAAIIGALMAEGVQNVVLASPAADIAITRQQAAHCTGVTMTDGGTAE